LEVLLMRDDKRNTRRMMIQYAPYECPDCGRRKAWAEGQSCFDPTHPKCPQCKSKMNLAKQMYDP